MTVAEAVDIVRPSIVQIGFFIKGLPEEISRQIGSDIYDGSLGTGFFVNADGYVITARHVITEGRATLEKFQARRKQMLVGIAMANIDYGGIVMRGNFNEIPFDIVDEDPRHDLALLKLQRNPFTPPSALIHIAGQEIQTSSKVAILSMQRPRDGDTVAVSGYPLSQPVLVTNAGWMATSWSYDITKVRPPGAPEWFQISDIADSYLADVTANPGNSGGPVYQVETGFVIGICVAGKLVPVKDQNGQVVTVNGHQLLFHAGLTIVVPIQYVVELLKKHNLSWSEPGK